MSNVKMDAQYFIDKFEAIPENHWCLGNFSKMYTDETHIRNCAYGHCGERWSTGITPESAALSKLVGDAGEINDGGNEKYQQQTPKQRILAALYDAKERGL